METLLIRDPALWSRDQAIRLSPDKPTYLLKVSPDLRAFITVLASGDIELLDIMREETLRLFLERLQNGSKLE